MNQPLSVHADDVKSLSEIHDRVSAAMAQLTGSTPDAAALQSAYGTISSAFTSALGATLPSRDGTFQAAQASSQTIGELLREAAAAYERGDGANAEKLRAAADALAGSDGGMAAPGGAAAASAGPAAPATGATGAGGPEMVGQLAGQVGQQVGQVAQGIAQSVQGILQGLTQLPQQVMQGMAGSSTKGTADTDGADVKETTAEEERARKDADEESAADEERTGEERRRKLVPPSPGDGAQPGQPAAQDKPPETPPAAPRPQPAQTRPQQSPL